MVFSAATIFNCVAIAGIATMMLVNARHNQEFMPGSDGIDTIATASVQPLSGILPKEPPSRFTVISHKDGRSCTLKLYRANGYNVHRIEPGTDCEAVTADLPDARAWQENGNGLVAITDRAGNQLMKLIPGDGFAWEVIEPANLVISFKAF